MIWVECTTGAGGTPVAPSLPIHVAVARHIPPLRPTKAPTLHALQSPLARSPTLIECVTGPGGTAGVALRIAITLTGDVMAQRSPVDDQFYLADLRSIQVPPQNTTLPTYHPLNNNTLQATARRNRPSTIGSSSPISADSRKSNPRVSNTRN